MVNAYVQVEGVPSSVPEGQRIVNQDLYCIEPTPGPPGPQGQEGDITKAWPLNDGASAVFLLDKEEADPATILGFGIWEKVGKIPSLDIWAWKRTA